jgi:hypothetical protein
LEEEEEDYLRVKTRVLIGVRLFPRVTLMETTLFVTCTDTNSISSHNLGHMKSWKKDERWMEQNAEWRKSGNLALYPALEKDGSIYVELQN